MNAIGDFVDIKNVVKSKYTDLYKNLFNACAHLIVKNKNSKSNVNNSSHTLELSHYHNFEFENKISDYIESIKYNSTHRTILVSSRLGYVRCFVIKQNDYVDDLKKLFDVLYNEFQYAEKFNELFKI